MSLERDTGLKWDNDVSEISLVCVGRTEIFRVLPLRILDNLVLAVSKMGQYVRRWDIP